MCFPIFVILSLPVSHVGGDGHPGRGVELGAAGVGEQLPEVGLRHAAARHHADSVQPVQLGDQFPAGSQFINYEYDERLLLACNQIYMNIKVGIKFGWTALAF